jgi:RNA polymerase-interacting CarD/CdnL/TRCF family regulator
LNYLPKSCNILIQLNNVQRTRITARRKLIPFIQGDTIHHPHHGIGQVQSICKRSFSGEKETTFAQLHFKRDGLTLMLRKQDLATTVRNPINASEARQLLDHLETWNGTVSNQWKARANANQETMERGDPFGYAEVYMGLSKLEAEGTLRASDRAHLNQSLDFLTEELANALGQSPEQTRIQIMGTQKG